MKRTQLVFGLLPISVGFGLAAVAEAQQYSFSTISGAYVVIPNNASLNTTNNALTVECWFNRQTGTSDWNSLVSKESLSSTMSGFDLRFASACPNADIQLSPESVYDNDIYGYNQGDHQNTSTNKWQHYAMQYDGTNYLVWIDGTLFFSTNCTAQIVNVSNPISIGCQNSGYRPFNGWIAEVRVSNIGRYYTTFVPQTRFATDANTMALYHFDEGAGSVVADSSGNGNDGSIQGSSAWTTNVPSPQYANITNGLVAYYPFNGNANDASGNGSNGTPFNITYGQDRFGVAGAAAFFNGNNSFILVTNFFSSQPTQITYSIWFATPVQASWMNLTSVLDQWNLAVARSGGGGDYVVGTFHPTTMANGGNSPIYGNAAPGFGLYKFESTPGEYYCDITNFVFLSNQWHHVAGVYDGSTMTLYLDGIFQDSLQYASGGQQVLDNLEFGNNLEPGNLPAVTPFLMDDVRIYNRALSSNEVQQLYQYEATTPDLSFLTNGLVAYYPFNGNASDASGNGHDGIVENTYSTTNQFGQPNSALGFTGNSWVYVPYSASLYTTNYSVSLMFNSFAAFNSYNTMLGCGAESWRGYAIDVFNFEQDFGFVDSSGTGYGAMCVTPLGNWQQNDWYNLTFTRSASTAQLYSNGVLIVSQSNLPPFAPPQQCALYIGSDAHNPVTSDPTAIPTTFFTGIIHDVRLYNRTLSSSEVAELYAYESVPPSGFQPATATATIVDGFCVAATITEGGSGYTNTPLVLIQGGGGTGATGTAVVSNGVVVGITMTDAGIGYTNTPNIYIYFPNAITAQPQSLAVNAYGTASFGVTATSTLPVNYQWAFNGTNIVGATNSTLAISNVVPTNLGTYTVVASNLLGSVASSNASLSMYPIIVSPFAGVVTDWGYTNILSVRAWGSGPLGYQWFNNGVAILNATNPTLAFTNIQFTNAGLYTVVVSNALGSVTNIPEQVVVNPAGVSLGLYPGVTISGVVGYNYIIQSTTNLANTNSWVTVDTLTLAQPIQLWVDTNTDTTLPANPQRYYQVLPGQ
jgi:hypothetical protein